MNKENEKCVAELALELYAGYQATIERNPNLSPEVVLEALYLVMQMAYGPTAAGRVISCSQVRK